MHEIKSINTVVDIFDDTKLNFLSMICSINGIISLFVPPNEIFQWNPSLRKFKPLPPSAFCYEHYSLFSTCGIVYDQINDDYKAVKTYCFFNDYKHFAKLKIYSLMINSWRLIESPQGMVFYGHYVFINGAYHWLDGCKGHLHLTSLNLAIEMYDDVPIPRFTLLVSIVACWASWEGAFVYCVFMAHTWMYG